MFQKFIRSHPCVAFIEARIFEDKRQLIPQCREKDLSFGMLHEKSDHGNALRWPHFEEVAPADHHPAAQCPAVQLLDDASCCQSKRGFA